MAAPALATLNPYLPVDIRKFYWVPTIGNIASPTRGELDAGNDLTPQVVDAPGWFIDGSIVQSQSFVGPALNLIGAQSFADSSLVMRLSRTSTDARTILIVQRPALTGYIVKFPEGDTTGFKMDVFSVAVNAAPQSPGQLDPATAEFKFAIFDARARVTVP
jgi:hypothetical protein